MTQTNKTRLMIAMAVVALLAFSAPLAHANLVIEYSANGTTWTPFVNQAGNTYTLAGPVTVDGITLTGLGVTTNATGTPTLADIFSTTLSASNTSGSTATVYFSIVQQGFLSPTAPPALIFNSNIGGTVVAGSSANALTLTSCIDQSAPSVACQSSLYTSAVDAPNITSPGSYNASTSSFVSSLTSPYSLEQEIKITLGNGASGNGSASTSLTPGVPEPTSIMLLGAGLLLSARGLMRKKRASQS